MSIILKLFVETDCVYPVVMRCSHARTILLMIYVIDPLSLTLSEAQVLRNTVPQAPHVPRCHPCVSAYGSLQPCPAAVLACPKAPLPPPPSYTCKRSGGGCQLSFAALFLFSPQPLGVPPLGSHGLALSGHQPNQLHCQWLSLSRCVCHLFSIPAESWPALRVHLLLHGSHDEFSTASSFYGNHVCPVGYAVLFDREYHHPS